MVKLQTREGQAKKYKEAVRTLKSKLAETSHAAAGQHQQCQALKSELQRLQEQLAVLKQQQQEAGNAGTGSEQGQSLSSLQVQLQER